MLRKLCGSDIGMDVCLDGIGRGWTCRGRPRPRMRRKSALSAT